MRALILILLLAGCGDWTGMDCSGTNVQHAMITWERTSDANTTCLAHGALTLDRGGACIACITSGDTSACTMYAEGPQTIDDTILGHEMKHAFGCRHA